MFEFLMDVGNYDQRKVGRYDNEKTRLSISTASVSDAAQPYETAVAHPDYNDNKWVIVETYGSRKAAEAGHEKWVATMTAKTLPGVLFDRSSAGVATLADAFVGDEWRTIKRKRSRKKSN
jgi:hypothetical protein